jgi:hypothetical protein
MKEIKFDRRWVLTTEHPASSHGQPVLVDKRTGRLYGPEDIILVGPFPMRARVVVALALKNPSDATPEQAEFLRRFGVDL